jgi:hypothetical protein
MMMSKPAYTELLAHSRGDLAHIMIRVVHKLQLVPVRKFPYNHPTGTNKQYERKFHTIQNICTMVQKDNSPYNIESTKIQTVRHTMQRALRACDDAHVTRFF